MSVNCDIYDPAVKAFRSVSVEVAIQYIKEAKKLEKMLLSKGIVTADQVEVN